MLSIVIPCLNKEKMLPGLIKNIRSQKIKEKYEIIVSDGNSKDKYARSLHWGKGYLRNN